MGSAISSVLSVVTGGLVKSPEQKKAQAAQDAANAQEQALLNKQTEAESASMTRKAKLASGGGAMSLMSGTQLGVDEQKKKVLGQ